MILFDVNIFVEAFREVGSRHDVCRRELDAAMTSPSAFGVSPQALCSFVRIVTNRRIYDSPESTEDALAFSEFILGAETARVVTPGPRHWSIFSALCIESRIAGDPVSDAWFAALAIEHDCEWVTLDRDFARFPGLRWRTPG